MKAKKFFGLLLVLLVLVMAVIPAGCSKKKVLRISMPGEYIDPELLTKFEKEFDCKIQQDTFDSNEAMYTKLMSGEEYDILIPSDYMIERLIAEEKLAEIDLKKVPNYENVNPLVKGQAFDPDNKYTVPYFYGTVGIVYDTTVIDEADLAQGWNILTNTKYKDKLYMYDSERDSFMVALKALGYSMNTTNETEINAAYDWLINQRDTMNPIYVCDEVMDSMIAGNKAMAVVYSGDAVAIISENEKLAFFEPDEGTNFWVDGMVMTKECKETDLAYSFMNFILENENATANTIAVGYTSPITEVANKVKNEDFADIDCYMPKTSEKNEVFRHQKAEVKAKFAELWTKVKAH